MTNAKHDKAAERDHGAKAAQEKSLEREKLERGPLRNLDRAAMLREGRKELLQEVLGVARDVKNDVEQRCERMEKAARTNASDHFAKSPDTAVDHRSAQREAAEQVRTAERQRELERAVASLREAAQTTVAAIESLSVRHRAEEARLQKELTEALKAAPNAGLAANELRAQQREREAMVSERLDALADRHMAEAERLGSFVAEMRKTILAFAQEAQKNLAEGTDRSHDDAMVQSRERSQRFEEECRDIVALRNLWDGRFADIEALKRTWEKAAKGERSDAAGYDAARSKFWDAVNNAKANADKDAQEVRRLLDRARVEWQGGSNAPLMAASSARLDEMKKAAELGDKRMNEWVEADRRARLITIDHVADKGRHAELALDASNLRLLANSDNSARGKHYDVADLRNLDFVRSKERQETNAQRRDARRGERADESHDIFEEMAIALAEARVKREQALMAVEREKAMTEAAANREHKLEELRASKPRHLDGESEEQRRASKASSVARVEEFLEQARKQIERFDQFEKALAARQQRDLAQAQKELADQRETLSARQALGRVRDLEQRLAEERAELGRLWVAMDSRRNADEKQMLDAIYQARSGEEREQGIERAKIRQEEAQREQEERIAELEKKRSAHD